MELLTTSLVQPPTISTYKSMVDLSSGVMGTMDCNEERMSRLSTEGEE